MEQAELGKFHLELESEITDSAKPDGDASSGEFRENTFTEIISQDLENCGVLESPAICYLERGQGSGSIKVNGYSIPEEDSQLDIFITHYTGPYDNVQSINSSQIETAFNKLERFLGRAFSGFHETLEPGLEPYGMAERIHGLQSGIDRINFLLFTNARLAQRRERERKPEVHGKPASYEVWDIERFRRLRQSGTSYEALNVDLKGLPSRGLPAVRIDSGENGFQTWVTAFPGSLLADLYNDYGPRLLELNVRSYLQARGKVNKGILETLRFHPQDFMAYNNGITVVAEHVETGTLPDGSNGIQELRGLQIVNGGQTTASIHRAVKEFGVDLSHVYVQGKVTVVGSERFPEIVPLISRYSNTQNKVTESDLKANHPFHVGMERVSRVEWTPDQRTKWFYERARGSYQTAKTREGITPAKRRQFETSFPPDKRFTKEDLAKFENCWIGLPHIVSRGAQKNFVQFMYKLGRLPESWQPTVEEYRDYVSKGILLKAVYRFVKKSPVITAWNVNVAAYTTALLADKTARRIDLKAIWQNQEISDSLRQVIEDWAPVVFKKLPSLALERGRHVEESFKSDKCWEYIRSLSWIIPSVVEQELVSAIDSTEANPTGSSYNTGERLGPRDHNNIARCKEIGEVDWHEMAAWGLESGQLEEWQRGVARTLAGYAAEGWIRLPSKKQAKHGAAMIEKARLAGIFQGNGN